MEIETPVLLAHAIKDSTDILGILGGGGFEHPKPPSVRHWFWGMTQPTNAEVGIYLMYNASK